jgi:hypothetical protein
MSKAIKDAYTKKKFKEKKEPKAIKDSKSNKYNKIKNRKKTVAVKKQLQLQQHSNH